MNELQPSSTRNPSVHNFLTGATGYLAGALAGALLIFLESWLGLAEWLFNLVDQNQIFLQILALPVLAGLMLALGGGLLGCVGGWALGRIIKTPHKLRLAVGSGIAFAVSISTLSLIFLILIGFLGLYNNLSSDRIEHYGIIFGFFGLIFGLFVGIMQAFLTVRVRYTWRVILASLIGFTLGGLLLGVIIRFLNPTTGFKTYPVLTFFILIIGLLLPFALGGGALGFTYGNIAEKATRKEEEMRVMQPSGLQIAIVALIGIVIVFPILNLLGQVADFLVIQPANLKSQLPTVATGVRWTEPRPTNIADNPSLKSLLVIPSGDNGASPVQAVDQNQGVHSAWCAEDSVIYYKSPSGQDEQIPGPGCTKTPAIAVDFDGAPHIIWYAQELIDTTGGTRQVNVLVESIRSTEGWSEPAIAAHTAGEVQPNLGTDEIGNLHLVWGDGPDLFHTIQERYDCSEADLSDLERVGLETILGGDFRPEGTQVPYCRNHYERIIYTPNPEPQYSAEAKTLNGAFDQVSLMAAPAQYEVLFATMQWEPSDASPSPGSVLADEAAKLYEKVKKNPQNYPRGMTVRILLGNYPVMANFQWGTQIMDVLSDLRTAGVDKMVDPEIGWRIEVANFPGTYPHSHTKFLVVDGRTLMSAGFNYGYLHFSQNHPSGKGLDMLDLGIQVTGPVAQDGISTFDDLWEGADQIHCEDLSSMNENWQDTCEEVKAQIDHVPEVLSYYLPPEGNSNAFSLYRSQAYKEGDEFIAVTLASAQESVDMMQVNFSLDVICMLNLLYPDLCTIDNALPYMDALLEAIESNHIRVRVIMENTNSNGLENRVGGIVLMEELERRGLSELVELRFYNGKIHAKSTLIDDEFLIIGSHNMHYSSWGENGLTEHSLMTNDTRAASEYRALFETKWQEAIPFEDAKYGTSP